jgi:hypothetical protein
MAQSKTTNELLALGGALVEQFKLKADEDALGQWMVHYLAEKFLAHKEAVGEAKGTLETELVDLILKFWKHRAYFPRGDRPFENYEPVLRALESLDPDRNEGRYFWYRGADELAKGGETASKPWVDLAKRFDRGARAIVNFCVQQAARASDKPDDAWLSAAKVLPQDTDRDLVVIKIITEQSKEDDKEIDPIEFSITRAKKVQEDLLRLLGAGRIVLQAISGGLEELEATSGKSKKVKSKTETVPSGKMPGNKKQATGVSSRKKPRKKVAKARAPPRRNASR